jgi:hypothetical protein
VPHPDDLFVAEFALRKGWVSKDDLLEALWAMEEERKGGHGVRRPLGVVLVTRGHLRQKDLQSILSRRVQMETSLTESQSEDLSIGSVLVAAGVATQQQISECLAIQHAQKEPKSPSPRLGEILVGRGYATPEQIHRVLAYHQKVIYMCPQCGKKFNVLNARQGQEVLCRDCKVPLTPPDMSEISAADTIVAPRVSRGTTARREKSEPAAQSEEIAQQSQIDRAIALYLRQRGMVRRRLVREAERLQLEFSRFGFMVPVLDILRRLGGISWERHQQLKKTDFSKIINAPAWKKQAVPGYLITGKIAVGGFATIFSGKQIFTNRQVALKILHLDKAKDPRARVMFRNESALLMRFEHPHIIKAYEYGNPSTWMHFLAMEFVQGEALDQILQRVGPFPPALALRVTRQAGEALQYLQREGYIHRDIKPENILLDERKRVRLCDLGFAAPIGDKPAKAGRSKTTVGTATYVSPEQASGEQDLKGGTDIYSLGLTLHAMLTGQLPSDDLASEEFLEQRFQDGFALPELETIGAPKKVIALLQKMVHPERTARFGNWEEFLGTMDKAKL